MNQTLAGDSSRPEDLIPVLTGVGLAGNVDPMCAPAVVLPDQLVEGGVVDQPAKPRAPLGDGGQVQVGRLATQVLALRRAPYRPVEGRAAIATADHDRFPGIGTERFEHHLAERFEMGDEGRWHPVVDAEAVGGGGALKLLHGEMFGYLHDFLILKRNKKRPRRPMADKSLAYQGVRATSRTTSTSRITGTEST